ncbi:M67 family metallopeptidase [Methanosphaerula subterraneus]|uniref:M67 family metallopeptidase n=1 Tax=Methanosphaerula subterraneus TaxID=3350244 RepID=UPI003F82DF21
MILHPDIVKYIVAHAEQDAPVEACGYLAGEVGRITRHYPMTNIDRSTDHFSFDPQEQFDVRKAARRDGLDLVGIYHSHPSSPANPSSEDVRLAYDPTLLYVIVSLVNGTITLNGFHIRQDTVEKVSLVIQESEP